MLQTPYYYCGAGDSEHFNEFGETELIFEALCSFYDAVNHPEEGDEDYEIGYYEIVDNQIEDLIPLIQYEVETETFYGKE